MDSNGRARRLLLTLLILPLAAPAGCASHRSSIWDGPDRTVVQRPAYAVDGTKPLFLGGYAGADYNPNTRMRP